MFSFFLILFLILLGLILQMRARLQKAETKIAAMQKAMAQGAAYGDAIVADEAAEKRAAEVPWAIGLDLPHLRQAPARQQAPPEPLESPAPAPSPAEPSAPTDTPIEKPAPLPAYVAEHAAEEVAAHKAENSPKNLSEAQPEMPHSQAAYAAAERPSNSSSVSHFAHRFEHIFGKMLPIWVGGLTLAIAGVLIIRYAIDAGFFAEIFTPKVQVIAGLIFGLGLIGGAEYAFRHEEKLRDLRVAQALSGAGLATLFAAILTASNIYGLIGPWAAFLGLAMVTAGALGLALRFGAPSALLALLGGLAAPALISAAEPNVPLLTIYLALTVGGLISVSQRQGWLWLAAGALLGSAGWGFALALMSDAMAATDALAVGGFILLMAIALPFFAFHHGQHREKLQIFASLFGALQMAVLLSHGGFILLHWGLFILLAAAGQILAWRNRSLAMVPSIGILLAAALLFMWPNPSGAHLALIGGPLLLIYALPLLLRLWNDEGQQQVAAGADEPQADRQQTDGPIPPAPAWNIPLPQMGGLAKLRGLSSGAARPSSAAQSAKRHAASAERLALELCLAAFAPILLIIWHLPGAPDILQAAFALLGAALCGAAMQRGWPLASRHQDARFALITSSGAALIAAALALILPNGWGLVALALIITGLAVFARTADDERLDKAAAAFLLVGLLLLAIQEVSNRFDFSGAAFYAPLLLCLRWGSLALAGGVIAWKSNHKQVQAFGQMVAAFIGCGAAVPILSLTPLILLPAVAAAALMMLAAQGRMPLGRTALMIGSLALVSLAWALPSLAAWLQEARFALAGMPMLLDGPYLSAADMARRILLPALLYAGGLWWMLRRMKPEKEPQAQRFIGTIYLALAAALAIIGLHGLYRLGFAAVMGDDFTSYGIAQRLIWSGLFIGAAWVAAQRQKMALAWPLLGAGLAHILYFSLLWLNPLWSAQAVGPWPIANMLLPLYALPFAGLFAAERWSAAEGQAQKLSQWPLAQAIPRLVQLGLMLLIIGFAFSSLRHAFHGSMLSHWGVKDAENILRSILLLALALGYLLWGMKRGQHDWRIASLLLMISAAVKVFLFDASGLDGLARIASFIALGFSLIGIGWLYSRQLAPMRAKD